MGTKGRSILGMKAEKVVELLNAAFSDEWMAYYQYWLGAKIITGPMKDAVIAELNQHAADELRHATMLSMRIIQLGGTPVPDPKQWFKLGHCGYAVPSDPYVKPILDQNIKGEQCAIGVYSKLIELTRGKDDVTYNMALQILQDEVTHEEDLQALADDLQLMVKRGGR